METAETSLESPRALQAHEMAKTTATVIIGRPMAEVFALLADLRNVPRWDPAIESVDLSGPVALGTWGMLRPAASEVASMPVPSSLPFEVVEYEPPSRLAIKASEGSTDATVRWSVAPVAGLPDVTRVTVETIVQGRGLLRVAERMFGALTPKDSSKALLKLKDLLELGSPGPHQHDVSHLGPGHEPDVLDPAATRSQAHGPERFPGQTFSSDALGDRDASATVRAIRQRRLRMATEFRGVALKIAIIGGLLAGATVGVLVGLLLGPELGALAALLVVLAFLMMTVWA